MHAAKSSFALADRRIGKGFACSLAEHFSPSHSVKNTAVLFLPRSTPLLEKERYLMFPAKFPNPARPVRLHSARARPRLAADDNPINSPQVEFPEIFEQRLNRKKFRARAGCLQFFDPVQIAPLFDADPHPDVLRPIEQRADFGQPPGPMPLTL